MNLKGSLLWFLVCHRCECTNSMYKLFSLGVLIVIHDTNRLVALVIHRFELKSTFANCFQIRMSFWQRAI